MAKYGLLIDYYYCTGCKSCEVACGIEHGIPVGQFGIKVHQNGPWEYAPDKWQLSYVPTPTDLCDLCAERVAQGKQPSCVHNCMADCMRYGTAEELLAYMGDATRQVIFFPEAQAGVGSSALETYGQAFTATIEGKADVPAAEEAAGGLSLQTTIGEVMDDAAVAAVFEECFPGVLADPNMANGKMLTFDTFVQFPQAAEKGITSEALEAFFAKVNAADLDASGAVAGEEADEGDAEPVAAGLGLNLSMSTKIGEIMSNEAAAALFEKHFPGVLADPNMKNGAMLKLGTFVKFPQAKEKGITKDKLEAFFAEANA